MKNSLLTTYPRHLSLREIRSSLRTFYVTTPILYAQATKKMAPDERIFGSSQLAVSLEQSAQ
jgi:hypothetical protein